VYADTFSLGPVSVTNMSIGSATSLQGVSAGTFKSGILGLAFEAGNSVKPTAQPTFMEMLLDQQTLDVPVFVCNFKTGGGGFIEFGRVDDSLYTGSLSTIQAKNSSSDKYPGSWSSEGVKYVSNGRELGTFDIVFDTGGPGTSGPINVVRDYYAQVIGSHDTNGDGSDWSIPCDAHVPDLTFVFDNGVQGSIPGNKMVQKNGDGTCKGWLVKENSATRGLVGDAFFDSNVVVFDQRDASISWAPQA
jgi:Eukaryotic aspartyl protease